MFIILKWITAGILAATVFSFFATHAWLFELCSHFRLHYSLGLILLAILFALGKRPRSALIALVFSIANIMPVWHELNSYQKPVPVGESFKIISANINHSNRDLQAFARWIDSESPSLLLILELTDQQLAVLSDTLKNYPYRTIETRNNGFGIGLFSRIHPERIDIVRLADVDTPIAHTRFNWAGIPIQLYGLHLWAPEMADGMHGRNRQLTDLARTINAQTDERFILFGDFNTTPWSPYFQQFHHASGLIWSRPTLTKMPTWPAPLGAFGIPLDLCLTSPQLAVQRVERGPNIGSDHYPIVIELGFPEP